MSRRVAGAVALMLVAALLVATGCQQEAAQVQRTVTPAAPAQVAAQTANAQVAQWLTERSELLDRLGEPPYPWAGRHRHIAAVVRGPDWAVTRAGLLRTVRVPRPAWARGAALWPPMPLLLGTRAPAAGPDDPPHLIYKTVHLGLVSAAATLERELPEDFVRVWVQYPDGRAVHGCRCRVSGGAVAGITADWFTPHQSYFILGNPAEGDLTIQVRAKGCADATRRVALPPREQRLKADRRAYAPSASGPDIVVRTGRIVQRYLYLWPSSAPPGPASVRLTWHGKALRETRVAPLTGSSRGDRHVHVAVPRGARRVSVEGGSLWAPLAIEVAEGHVTTSASLRPYGSFSVSGRAVTPDGGTPESATVVLSVAGREMQARADGNQRGWYHFHSVPGGRLRLTTHAVGYGSSRPVELSYDGASDITAPTLTLPAPGRLRVIVRDGRGRVSEGVLVGAEGGGDGRLVKAMHRDVTEPDWDGAFVLTGLTEGKWTVHADAGARGWGLCEANVRSGETTTATAAVKAGRPLRARILTADGLSVGATEVQYEHNGIVSAATRAQSLPPAYRPGLAQDGWVHTQTTQCVRTTADGWLVIPNAARTARLAVLTRYGHGQADDPSSLGLDGGPLSTTIRLAAPAVVEGTIVLPAGAKLPKSGLTVALSRRRPLSPQSLADPERRVASLLREPFPDVRLLTGLRRLSFRLEDVVPAEGDWTVQVHAPGIVAEAVPLELEPGKTTKVRIATIAAGRVRGRLRDPQGRPVVGATVWGGHAGWWGQRRRRAAL